MALARLDVPAVMLYGGSMAPGRFRGKDVTIQDVFEAVGAHAAGDMSDEDLAELESVASPGAGACGGQYTANTMATAFEMLGVSAMGTSMVPAEDGKKGQAAEDVGRLVVKLIEDDVRPSTIITRDALENAIACVAATGGSTNAVLHLLALARDAGVELAIDDFDRVSERTPLLADLKPRGGSTRRAPPGCSSPRRTRSQRSSARRSSRATWWSSATRGPPGGPGCARCSR